MLDLVRELARSKENFIEDARLLVARPKQTDEASAIVKQLTEGLDNYPLNLTSRQAPGR